MSRLTYKLDEPIETKYLHYDYMKIADYDITKGNSRRITNDRIYNKLGELEDLEEELGISLPILFKAFKNGIIVESDGEKDELDGWRLSISFEQKCFVFTNFWGKFGIYFEDYGKTWRLKEDLKSE